MQTGLKELVPGQQADGPRRRVGRTPGQDLPVFALDLGLIAQAALIALARAPKGRQQVMDLADQIAMTRGGVSELLYQTRQRRGVADVEPLIPDRWTGSISSGTSAVAIAAAGPRLVYAVTAIGEHTGAGQVWLGTILLAGATSLPELVSVVSASVIDAPDSPSAPLGPLQRDERIGVPGGGLIR